MFSNGAELFTNLSIVLEALGSKLYSERYHSRAGNPNRSTHQRNYLSSMQCQLPNRQTQSKTGRPTELDL